MSERLNNPERDTAERFAKFVIDHMPDVSKRHKEHYGPAKWELDRSDQGVPVEQISFEISDNDSETPLLTMSLIMKSRFPFFDGYGISWDADSGFGLFNGMEEIEPTDEAEVNRLLELLEKWETEGDLELASE